jgi:hypothetical protein
LPLLSQTTLVPGLIVTCAGLALLSVTVMIVWLALAPAFLPLVELDVVDCPTNGTAVVFGGALVVVCEQPASSRAAARPAKGRTRPYRLITLKTTSERSVHREHAEDRPRPCRSQQHRTMKMAERPPCAVTTKEAGICVPRR